MSKRGIIYEYEPDEEDPRVLSCMAHIDAMELSFYCLTLGGLGVGAYEIEYWTEDEVNEPDFKLLSCPN